MSEEEIWNMILAAHNDHMNREHAQDKRFEAAKAAMQGMLANSVEGNFIHPITRKTCTTCEETREAVAIISVQYADNLLAELERTKR